MGPMAEYVVSVRNNGFYEFYLILEESKDESHTEKRVLDQNEHVSDKSKKFLSVGNSGILSVLCPSSCLHQLM